MKEGLRALGSFLNPKGKRIAVLETNPGCNRTCEYCDVHTRYDPDKSSTLEQAYKQIDWIYDQGFRTLQSVGGEPLSPFLRTKEGITFQDYSLAIIKYAHQKGMVTNLSTNGDYANKDVLEKLKAAGLDTLTISLHSYNEQGLKHVLDVAKMAAETKIPPIISAVFTAGRTDTIPEVAKRCAENGVFFAIGIVQEKGGGFSKKPEKSQIPTPEQQKKVFEALMPLKRAGFVRNNMVFLKHAADYPNNSWICDPDKDSSINIRAQGEKGEIRICSEVSTDFKVGEINLKDQEWRQKKEELVKNCKGCMMSCTFEGQEQDLIGDLPTLAIMGLIRYGHAGLARRLGQLAARKGRPFQPIP